jgi:hypothetical protein
MPKWAKLLLAIALLPVCAGAARTLWMVIQHAGAPDTTWVPLLAGAACWLVIFAMLPKPMWLYVLGHEFTHVLWTWLFGGAVKQMKVTSAGGHVVVSKSNFLIILAPYFFPLYAGLVILTYAVGHFIWNWHGLLPFFYLAVGAAYAFHLTLTFSSSRPSNRISPAKAGCSPGLLFSWATFAFSCWASPCSAQKSACWTPSAGGWKTPAASSFGCGASSNRPPPLQKRPAASLASPKVAKKCQQFILEFLVGLDSSSGKLWI